jgi:hypothetical protein
VSNPSPRGGTAAGELLRGSLLRREQSRRGQTRARHHTQNASASGGILARRCQFHVSCHSDYLPAFQAAYLRRPPPPRLKPPPPRDDMLEEPRELLLRALEPLYPLVLPPKASRFPPPLRERSRLPMRSAPPPAPYETGYRHVGTPTASPAGQTALPGTCCRHRPAVG